LTEGVPDPSVGIGLSSNTPVFANSMVLLFITTWPWLVVGVCGNDGLPHISMPAQNSSIQLVVSLLWFVIFSFAPRPTFTFAERKN
jgi:hypothetical protein